MEKITISYKNVAVSFLFTFLFLLIITPYTTSAQNNENEALVPIIHLLLDSTSGPLRIQAPSTLPSGILAHFYRQSIQVAGGTPPYFCTASVPFIWESGLILNPTNGLLSGFPRVVGQNTFSVRVTDADSTIVEKEFTLQINTMTQSESPAPPSDLTTISLGSDRIGLDWVDNSDNEDYFEIERSNDVVNFSYYDQWSGSPSVDDYPLFADTYYCYRIRAHNGIGDSTFTNISCKWTDATAIPRAPTNLTAQAVSENKILLTWTNNSQSDQYQVWESVNGGSHTISGIVPEDNVPGAYIEGLTAGNTYSYQIKAHNNFGYSVISTVSNSVTTPGASLVNTFRLVNNTSYPIISLVIDGAEQFPQAPQGIPPGGSHEVSVGDGTHSYRTANGFWNGSSRFEMYVFQNSWVQFSGIHTVTINNPSINQLLTKFSSSGYFLGETWEGTSFHYQGFRFFSNGTYNFYRDNALIGAGTYSLSLYPGSYTVTFNVAGIQSATGYYNELGGNFTMNNGPADWRTVKYLDAGN